MNKLHIGFFIAVSTIFIQACLSNPDIASLPELQAIKIVQDLLKTQKQLRAEPLVGGLSEASLITVTSDDQAYVVRFLGANHFGMVKKNEHEIACQQIASDTRYGPHVYGFDEQSGYIVMQYLQPESFPASKNQLSAHIDLVKKIHGGPAYPVTFKYFDQINNNIKALGKKKQNIFDLAKIKMIINKIEQAVSCFPHLAACHRDLHPGNVICSRKQFFAIDYTLSGQDDPYIDLAAFIFQFHGICPGSQEILLREYFGRQPTDKELAKISLMRLAVLIFHGVSFPQNIPEEFLQVGLDQDGEPKGYLQILQEFGQGTFDLGNPSGQVEFVRALFAEVLKYYDSDQFNKEIMLLQEAS